MFPSSNERRYADDPQFRALVDLLYMQIVDCKYSPSELRAAAMLAAIHYDQRHPRVYWLPRNEMPDSTGGK